ncbi:MAG: LLM class flavin-dependent oxidoreductase [Candidatus Tectimicrobiota bacterium]
MPLQMIGVSLTGSFPQGMPALGELFDNVRRVERLGYDALWSGDHIIMHSPIMDVMTVLASFAALTERIKLGTAVYLLPLRHPVATAKQVASLDLLSGGRFIFGVGVGGEIRREFEAVGVPVTERGRRTDEALDILTRVLSQAHVTYEGKYYQIHDVTLEPRPQQQPYPPLWIGGRSEAAVRRTARYASGWLGYLVSSQRLREAMQQIQHLAPTYGRDPVAIQGGMLLFTAMARDYETARQMAIANLSRRYNQPFESLVERYCVLGTPEQCLEKVATFVEAGMSNLVFSFTCPADQMATQLEWCAADLLPRLRLL